MPRSKKRLCRTPGRPSYCPVRLTKVCWTKTRLKSSNSDQFQLSVMPSNQDFARQFDHGLICACWPSLPAERPALTNAFRTPIVLERLVVVQENADRLALTQFFYPLHCYPNRALVQLPPTRSVAQLMPTPSATAQPMPTVPAALNAVPTDALPLALHPKVCLFFLFGPSCPFK